MPHLTSTEDSPFSPAQLFALVADVEKYPQFLPWCRAARILKRDAAGMEAELVISFSAFTESYVSRVDLSPPLQEHGEGRIAVTMLRGPFNHLTNHWRFTPLPDGLGTRIELALDFKFRSRLLDSLIGTVFERATLKMTKAFKERAEALYAPRPGPVSE